MALRLADKWVWDFWLAHHDSRHHIFYLQAPRALGNARLRHHHATVGHAVSDDLTHWEVLPDALHTGAPGAWDDFATWTGSVIKHDGRWHMLYTGINRAELGRIQRIGLAVSDDLIHWHKDPGNPVLQAAPEWYDGLDLARWPDQSWRDPYLFRIPGDDLVHAFITARSRTGAPDAAGVVAHARSADLRSWEVLPPVTEAGDFAQMEVPQIVHLGGRYVLLISCLAEDHSAGRLGRLRVQGETGTFILSAEDPLGPFALSDRPLVTPGGSLGPLYAGKLVQAGPGDWRFLAFKGDGDRAFQGELTDPLPVHLDQRGGIVVELPHSGRRNGSNGRRPLAAEIQALIDWGSAFERSHPNLRVPELREKLREAHDGYMTEIGMTVEPVAATRDLTVAVPGASILMRIFTPPGPGPHPAFMHLHGGGFIFGTIDSIVNDAKCAHLCRHAECLVATVEYRLAPEFPFPTAVEDCYAALCLLSEHAEELGVDPDRIAVGGESAGGNLAAAVALLARDRSGPPLVLQVLEMPVTDLGPTALDHPSMRLFAEGYGLDRTEVERFTAEYLSDPLDAATAYASPLLAADLAGLPPARILTAEFDVLRDSAEAYARRLQAAGVDTTLQRMLGHTHGSAVLWPAWEPAAEWMRAVVSSLRRALHPAERR